LKNTNNIHIVETPERVRFKYDIASLANRVGALAFDLFLQIVVFIIVSIILGSLYNASGSETDGWTGMFFIIYLFVFQWGYFLILEWLMNGSTPGKKLAKIRVIRSDGGPLDFPTLALRNLLRAVDHFPVLPLVGGLVCLFHKKRKRLGDFLANTIVVNTRSAHTAFPHAGLQLPARPGLTLSPKAFLSQRQLGIIQNYLLKQHSNSVTKEMGMDQLAKSAAKALELEIPRGVTAQSFLMEVYRFHALPHQD
jgi:uncharacterized RDD family membrane protein YckC